VTVLGAGKSTLFRALAGSGLLEGRINCRKARGCCSCPEALPAGRLAQACVCIRRTQIVFPTKKFMKA